jgi:hypothetical protein
MVKPSLVCDRKAAQGLLPVRLLLFQFARLVLGLESYGERICALHQRQPQGITKQPAGRHDAVEVAKRLGELTGPEG